ncbi:MAG: hypothetical protein PWR01_4064 [Clostridiales bacterium]|jgi:hypothetical protein|nr:hypothetical protein [Clostridiales bacterium]MDN5282991.1 hypothetical protein [Candidatus Ozemobacter sp.]
MTTASWVKIHGYISIFFLPLALIYAITGALIIVGERGNLAKEEHVIKLDHQLLSDLNAQKNAISDFFSQKGETKLPTGEPKLIRGELYWGLPSSVNVSLKKGNEPNEAILQIRKPDLLFSLVILHRARGGRLFDYLGFVFALAMIFMYLSGIVIFWKIKSKRIALSLTFAGGTVVTVIVFFLSL